jgi:hypothetical protein
MVFVSAGWIDDVLFFIRYHIFNAKAQRTQRTAEERLLKNI